MIAKRIQSLSRRASSVARLVRYAVNAQGGLDPRSWSRTADYVLDLNAEANQRGEKVSAVRVSHCCGVDDPAVATLLIEATQARNTRSQSEKTYHLVFSFRQGEHPPQSVLHAIEDELCAAIGLADHQRISAVHVDTDNLHVHVAINKVHPTGLQNIEPFYDKRRLMEACERLELEYGLEQDHHGLYAQSHSRCDRGLPGGEERYGVGERAATTEAQSGMETLAGYVAREVAPAMRAATSWQDMHEALAEHGLRIKTRGAGLVIGDERIPLWVRASQCGREFSMKAMTDRLGAFVPPVEQGGDAAPAGQPDAPGYVPKPASRHPSTAGLFTQYQRDRQACLAERKAGFGRLHGASAQHMAQLRQWKSAQLALSKIGSAGAARKAMAASINAQARIATAEQHQVMAQQRTELFRATAVPTWLDWLAAQAERGNVEALEVLRSRAEKEAKWRGDLLTTERAEQARTVINQRLRPAARRDGVMTYRTADGGLVVDRKRQVQAQKATAGAALVALSLASEKFAGQPLVVEGTDQFKQDVARLAGLHRFNVTFNDPGMEAARKAATPAPPLETGPVPEQSAILTSAGEIARPAKNRHRTSQNEL